MPDKKHESPKKDTYRKPELRKEGRLKDITAGRAST